MEYGGREAGRENVTGRRLERITQKIYFLIPVTE
jgi:hypothetical protein